MQVMVLMRKDKLSPGGDPGLTGSWRLAYEFCIPALRRKLTMLRKSLGLSLLLVCGFGDLPLLATARPDLQAALDEAYQDEYEARSRYEKVLMDFGNIKPFSQIVQAEGRHMNALEQLYAFYQLQVPVLEPLESKGYASVGEACRASVEAERKNIQLFDRLLEGVTEENVRDVFIRLRDASAERHLPAFQRCQDRETD